MEYEHIVKNARTRSAPQSLVDIVISRGRIFQITTRSAQALGIQDHELKEGNPANLVVLNAECIWEAIWTHQAPLHVIKAGRLTE